MTKNYIGLFFFLLLALTSFSQTNPATQNLPFNITSQSGNTLPAGVAMHRFAAIPTTRTLSLANADLPYAALSVSGGWRDEGTNGLSLLASAAQQAGALIISVNTTGNTNIEIQWTVRLILQQ